MTSGFGSYQSFSLGSLPRTSYVYQNNGTTVVQNRSTAGVEASTSARTYGRRTTVVDAEGRSTVTEFDARGNTLKVTDPAGTTNYGYNLRDQVTSIKDAKNNLITTEYDDWELEPTRLDDPDLGVVDYSYDAAGRLEFQTDARGNRIGVVYDVLSRTEELKWCDASGGACTPGQTVSSFAYDAPGRVGLLDSATHHNRRADGSSAGVVTTTNTYDNRMRLTAESWTIPGLPEMDATVGSETVSYQHRELGGMASVSYPDGTQLTYSYGPGEQVDGVTSGAGPVVDHTRFNARGQVVELWRGDPGWSNLQNALVSDYSYEAWSGRIDGARTRGIAVEAGLGHHITRLYRAAFDRDPDDHGYVYWLGQRADGVGSTTVATVFVNSAEFTSTWGTMSNQQFGEWLYTHLFGYAGDPGGISWWVAQLNSGAWSRGRALNYFASHAAARSHLGGDDAYARNVARSNETADVVQELSYTWDDVGNLDRLHETSAGVDQWQCFSYDNSDRLKQGFTTPSSSCAGYAGGGPFPFSVNYNYDSIGNITSASGTHTVGGSYTYNPSKPHAVTAAGAHSYQYDESGNQTRRSLNSGAQVSDLVYDVLNRLVEIDAASSAGSDLSALYDAGGNRVKRDTDSGIVFYLGETFEVLEASAEAHDSIGLRRPSSKWFYGDDQFTVSPSEHVTGAYGLGSDDPVMGDWDGDGVDTPGVRRDSERKFYLMGEFAGSSTWRSAVFGQTGQGDLPVAGDWDGNGTETIGVYKSANKRFYLRNTNAAGSSDIRSGPYGITGDIPIVGDWDGDGKDTMGVYRPSSRRFYLRNDWDGGVAQIGVTFGLAGDIPVVGDWDGDGVDSIGVFRPSTRRFYLSNSLSNTVDITSRVYGRSTDLPVTGNWNNSVGHDGTRVSVDVTITGMPVGTLIDGAFTAVAGDHLGSSSVVRDHHSKTRFQRYTPYGAIRDDSHRRNSLQVDETFTGQTHDPGTGLIDYNARHYDPQLGRFVMADTMLDGLNRYSYVGNNPLRYVDPSGYCMQELYDFCLDNLASGGAPESLGTKRLSPLTILSADDVQAVRSHLSMMQVGDPDAWAGSSASYYYAEHAFNAALYSGTIVDMGDGTFQLADCGDWCESYWADSIADVLLEDPGGTFSAVLDVAMFSTAGRWPGHPSMAKAVAPNSAVRCAANSFVPGTEVLMADGTTKPIEDVEIGDWVWVHDPETGETGARKVVDTIVGDGEKYLVDIEVLGDTITATDGHPFWITNDGAWADADDLEVGDRLLLADGDTAPVTAIDDRSVVQRVHNLTVDGIHTYFVSAGDEEVLVHNCRVGELKLADEFAGADADELAQLARGHGDVDNLTRPSFDQVRAALDTVGVRIRDGLDGRDLAVMFQHNGVTVIINEARPTRSTAFFAE